ncbi:MAG: hypothetical protein H0W61_10330 [Bacteroidetes bacterium]|nr:hypothetical protein [Bacteroidota bacterium]
MKKNKSTKKTGKSEDLPGYKHYPANEDIYSRSKEETDVDPEDITKKKPENEKNPDAKNEKDFKDSVSGDDLDIPGNEEDEAALGDGREDEENNYYSLGGDNRENLDENYGK